MFNTLFFLYLTNIKLKQISTMKNLFKFLFLAFSFFTFGIGLPNALAVDCDDVDYANGILSGSIIQVGGLYYYSIDLTNSGSAFTSDVNISITTNEFTVNGLSNQSIPSGPFTLNFLITSDVADITTGGGFGVGTTLTFISGTPAPCDVGGSLIVYTTGWGCTDPSAVNYDPSATFDNNSCLDHICDLLEILSAEIVYNLVGEPVLEVVIVNHSTYTLSTNTQAVMNIISSSPVFDVDNLPRVLNITPGGFKVMQFGINSPLNNLVGTQLSITGNIAVNAPDIPDLCQIDFNNFQIDISNLGCTDVTAFNYNQYATVDNETCVSDIVVVQDVVQPLCENNPFGSVDLSFSGGTPGYEVDYGSLDPDHLFPGTYIFSVTDETDTTIGGPIVQLIYVTIETPPLYEVTIALAPDNTTLVASVFGGSTTGTYYWLLDGNVIDSTNVPTYVYTTPGTYTCFVESPINALGQQCWDYSNGLILTQVGTDEYSNEGFVLYPNPSNGTFTVTLENYDANMVYAQIFDVQGREVYRIKSDNFNGQLNFDNPELSKGIYQIRVENGNHLYRSKLIIE